MAQVMDSPHRTHLGEGLARDDPMAPRTIPILTPSIQMSGPNDTEPMDIMTPTNSSAPASATKSPDGDRERDMNGASEPMRINNSSRLDGQGHGNAMTMTMPAPTAAAAAVHGPKIVQTAFIHKLYKCAVSFQLLAAWGILLLTSSQHARGQQHTASHQVVEFRREFRHVAVH